MESGVLNTLVRRIADRDAPRTEDDLQSDVRALLLWGGLNLDDGDLDVIKLESQLGDGTRRRIDIEVGFAVIETKKSLKDQAKITEAAEQLACYVGKRSEQVARRYVGILTDGALWLLYNLEADGVATVVSEHRVKADDPDVDGLILWLEGVLATGQDIPPSPLEISRRLGASSSSFQLDLATIRHVYALVRDQPEVRLKRELWARLLTTALGTQFEDSDDLFIEHTYLVTVAELVAHAAVGFSLSNPNLAPSDLLDGTQFRTSGIRGVVEPDFFDWLVDSEEALGAEQGRQFVSTLARRLSRFDWEKVEHDILKVLYESVISPEQRHQMGEYYTPDWLAQATVEEVVTDPLNQRVLDPGCGSGTFLFHAIRHYVAAAKAAGRTSQETIAGIVGSVTGVDLHPVAVTLARVTYLLAIGKALYTERGPEGFSIPVYLGDSLQWRQTDPATLFGTSGVRIPTADGLEMFAQELIFTESALADVGHFDALVAELAVRATNRKRQSAVPKLPKAMFATYGVPEDDRAHEPGGGGGAPLRSTASAWPRSSPGSGARGPWPPGRSPRWSARWRWSWDHVARAPPTPCGRSRFSPAAHVVPPRIRAASLPPR